MIKTSGPVRRLRLDPHERHGLGRHVLQQRHGLARNEVGPRPRVLHERFVAADAAQDRTGQLGIGTLLPIARLERRQDFTTGEGIRGRSSPSGSTGVRAIGNNSNGVGAWGNARRRRERRGRLRSVGQLVQRRQLCALRQRQHGRHGNEVVRDRSSARSGEQDAEPLLDGSARAAQYVRRRRRARLERRCLDRLARLLRGDQQGLPLPIDRGRLDARPLCRGEGRAQSLPHRGRNGGHGSVVERHRRAQRRVGARSRSSGRAPEARRRARLLLRARALRRTEGERHPSTGQRTVPDRKARASSAELPRTMRRRTRFRARAPLAIRIESQPLLPPEIRKRIPS